MRSAAIAEWVLSLVMPQERASATAGDLVESSRGAFGLTVAVLRVLAAKLGRQVSRSPSRAVVGVLQYLRFCFAYSIPMIYGLLFLSRCLWPLETPSDLIREVARVNYALLPCSTVAAFHIGIRIARRMPGEELLAWLAMSLLSVTWWTMSEAHPTSLWGPMHPQLLPLILAGLVIERRKWLRREGALA
jgi:hypothetical protein